MVNRSKSCGKSNSVQYVLAYICMHEFLLNSITGSLCLGCPI